MVPLPSQIQFHLQKKLSKRNRRATVPPVQRPCTEICVGVPHLLEELLLQMEQVFRCCDNFDGPRAITVPTDASTCKAVDLAYLGRERLGSDPSLALALSTLDIRP